MNRFTKPFLVQFLFFAASAMANDATSTGATAVSTDELAKIRAYVENYTKGVVIKKQFQDEYRQTISCVDIYHTPSHNDPNFAKAIFQLEPSESLKSILAAQGRPYKSTVGSDSICPASTVRMILPTVERIAYAGSLEKFFEAGGKSSSRQPLRSKIGNAAAPVAAPFGSLAAGYMHSFVYTPYINYIYGASTTFSIWESGIAASSYDHTISQVWLANYTYYTGTFAGVTYTGATPRWQSIEWGAQIAPQFYSGGPDPHFFIYWTAADYHEGSANYNGPGFYTLGTGSPSKPVTIGGTLSQSVPGTSVVEYQIYVARDPSTGNWFLLQYDQAGTTYSLGYFYSTNFGSAADGALSLANAANYVQWGGEIFSQIAKIWYTTFPPPNPAGPAPATLTDMGSGIRPTSADTSPGTTVAYQKELIFYGNGYVVTQFDWSGNRVDEMPACYNSYAKGSSESHQSWASTWGGYILFGGPGSDGAACTTN